MVERHPAEGITTVAGLAAELSDIGVLMMQMAEKLIRLKALAGLFCCMCTPDRGHDEFCQHDACGATGAHLVGGPEVWERALGVPASEIVRPRGPKRNNALTDDKGGLAEVRAARRGALRRGQELPATRCEACGLPYDEGRQDVSCPHSPLTVGEAVKIPEAGASTPQRLS